MQDNFSLLIFVININVKLRLIFPIVLLTLLLLSEHYIFQAVKTAYSNDGGWAKRITYIVYGLLSLIFYGMIAFSIIKGRGGWDAGKIIQGYAITLFLGIFLLKLFMSGIMLSEDIFRAGKWLVAKTSGALNKEVTFDYSRKRFISQLAIIAGAVPLVTLLNGAIRNAYRFKVYNTKVPIKNLPKPFEALKIVQISDLHTGSMMYADKLQQAVDMINQLEPDLVFFTGDIVNSIADEIEPFVKVLQGIQSKFGTYSVLGNHDYGYYHRFDEDKAKNEIALKANMQKLVDYHKKLGWDLLNNENRIIEIGNQKLAVIGVENWSSKPYFPSKGNINAAYKGCEDCAVKILLSHDPTHWREEITNTHKDIDLTLSGHTHGFQFGVEIPWIKWSPAKYAYKEWAGLYTKGTQHIYVNRGIGHLGYPGRVGILPEITSIALVPA